MNLAANIYLPWFIISKQIRKKIYFILIHEKQNKYFVISEIK